MTLYEAIYVRRSIRSFRMEPVADDILKGIMDLVAEMNPLFPQIKFRVDIVDCLSRKGKVGGVFTKTAPYYLAVFSEPKEKYDMNAGYVMQQISLYLTAKGVGSCFQGMGKMKESPADGMRFVMLMAFGFPKGALIRHDYEAKRLSLEELCVYKERPRTWVKEILEAARLAPSSFNSQPWRFVVYENRVHVFSKNPTTTASKKGKFNEFNFGVMLGNVMVAAEEIWVDLDLIKLNNITHKSIPNNQYMLSILLKA